MLRNSTLGEIPSKIHAAKDAETAVTLIKSAETLLTQFANLTENREEIATIRESLTDAQKIVFDSMSMNNDSADVDSALAVYRASRAIRGAIVKLFADDEKLDNIRKLSLKERRVILAQATDLFTKFPEAFPSKIQNV